MTQRTFTLKRGEREDGILFAADKYKIHHFCQGLNNSHIQFVPNCICSKNPTMHNELHDSKHVIKKICFIKIPLFSRLYLTNQVKLHQFMTKRVFIYQYYAQICRCEKLALCCSSVISCTSI